jgi:hypothetical protein
MPFYVVETQIMAYGDTGGSCNLSVRGIPLESEASAKAIYDKTDVLALLSKYKERNPEPATIVGLHRLLKLTEDGTEVLIAKDYAA